MQQALELQLVHEHLVGLDALRRRLLLLAQDLRLEVVVVEHELADLVGGRREQRVALLERDPLALHGGAQQDLDVDLVIRAVDPRGVVDRVGVDAPAGGRVLDAPALRQPEVAALGDDARAQLAAVDADGVGVAVADLRVRLAGGLDERADAAVPEQVDGGAEDRAHELVGVEGLGVDAQRGARLGRQRHRLLGARPDAAAGRDRGLVVVHPRRAGAEREEARALRVRQRRIRRRVEEHVPVVERGDEVDLARQQHAVAEHVARHVADADDGERARVDIAAELAEVPLDALPRAARGDAERLVVVALGAAGRERVAEPEAVLERDRVGRVGERGGALVGGDHEVRVVPVEGAHARRPHDLAADDVVGHVEHAADQRRVAQPHLLAQRVALGRRVAQDEARPWRRRARSPRS